MSAASNQYNAQRSVRSKILLRVLLISTEGLYTRLNALVWKRCPCTPVALPGDTAWLCRSENILALELDMPERVTFDILQDTGEPDPRAQAAIDQAFWEDGHILLLGMPGSPQQQLHLVRPELLGSYAVQHQAAATAGGQLQRPSSSASRRR